MEVKLLDKNCWSNWPQWECYAANIAGLISAGLWFIVLLPQVLKNWYRRSVVGLSFLWAVANFTASLVNLFFAFSIEVPLYVRISAVYMPILEIMILGQFLAYSHKPFTTRLLALLVCLFMWGGIIELELNLPESRDKIQWVAITLWSIETFPQVILNIKRQSTSGQATTSVFIGVIGKTTDFLVTYGLSMPLEYVVMCYFSSSSSFINGFQVFWYGKDSWYRGTDNNKSPQTNHSTGDERTTLLRDTPPEITARERTNSRMNANGLSRRTCRYWCITVMRFSSMGYISLGLIVFAVGFYLRTMSYIALLGPFFCFLVVFAANEYYNLKRKGHLKKCEEMGRRFEEGILQCEFGQDGSDSVVLDRDDKTPESIQ